MEIYETYKESGLNHIGKIPINWKVVKLKYIGDALTGITYSPNDIGLAGKLVLRSSNIQNGKLALDNNVYVDKDFNEKYIAREGDILICSRNGSRNLIGKNIIIKDELVGETWGAFMTVFRTEYSAFVYYFFNSTIFKSLASLFLSSTINQLTIGVINNFTIAIPSKEEQALIAKYLDHKTAIIDSLIEKKEQLIQKLQAKRQAIINEAVTKGLNPNAKMKDSGVEWLGEIPEHWEVVKLKYLTETIVTGKTPSTAIEEYFISGEVDWYSPGDFKSIHLESSNKRITLKAVEELNINLYPKNTILLIGIGATLGKVGIVQKECYSNQQINAIVFNEKMIPLYGLYFLDSIKEIIRNESNASTMAILNQSKTKDLLITYPPILEQNEIISFLQKTVFENNKITRKCKKSIQKLKTYRQSTISEAVTGKIDVRDWQHKNII